MPLHCGVPPLIFAVICWIAGAFVGSAQLLAHISTPALAGGMCVWALAMTIGAGHARPTTGTSHLRSLAVLASAFVTLCVASLWLARTGFVTQQRCRSALAVALNTGAHAHVVFDDHVKPRSSSRGVVTGTDALRKCAVAISARVTSGRAAPGQWMDLTGHAVVTERGLRVDAVLAPHATQRTDWLRAIRGRTGDVIDRDFGRNAPLVRALLIADQDGIPATVRDTYANAGLVHLLSVSGLHVAIIAGSLLTLAGTLRLSRTSAFFVSLIVIIAYVAVLGAPAPAVRSAVMLAVVGISERWQRPTHPWTALALGAVLPTVQPAVVFDLGYQLSVSGMAALVAARALLRRLRQLDASRCPRRLRPVLRRIRHAHGWWYGLFREGLTGTVATVVTAPIVAWTFGRLSVVAPLSNIVAGPIVAFLQPALFLALLLSPWPTLSKWIADASMLPIALLDVVARLAARIPHASVLFTPTLAGAICAGIAAAAFVWATGSRRWMPGLLVAVLSLSIAIWMPVLVTGSGQLELHVLDVGQGDALALRTPHGRWVLVDAGGKWKGGDAGRRTVIPYVRRFGGPVAGFVLTHAHDDHVGGAASLISALHPRQWWEPAFVVRSDAYLAALHKVAETGARWLRAGPPRKWSIDGVDIRILAPDSAWTAAQTDANETSVVLRVQYGDVVFLLTGDAEADEEAWIVSHTNPDLLRADVLKLGHHGSKTSSSALFLDAVEPRIGVVSVGAGNRYGHPSPETLESLSDRGVPVLRTDLEGTIVITTNGRTITVRVGRESWTVPRRQ